MAVEDFTTYTEVDPSSHATVTASKITVAGVTRNEDTYVYDDKGAGHFSGDFVHPLTVYQASSSSGTPYAGAGVLRNDIDDMKQGGDSIGVLLKNALNIAAYEADGGSEYFDQYSVSQDTPYYLELERDESVGTYGTLYVRIYSDAARTTLVATVSVALHSSKKDFRYAFPFTSYDSNNSSTTDGYVENYDLQEAAPGGGNARLLEGLINGGMLTGGRLTRC